MLATARECKAGVIVEDGEGVVSVPTTTARDGGTVGWRRRGQSSATPSLRERPRWTSRCAHSAQGNCHSHSHTTEYADVVPIPV